MVDVQISMSYRMQVTFATPATTRESVSAQFIVLHLNMKLLVPVSILSVASVLALMMAGLYFFHV
jgi:hypothetical protein